MSSEAHGYYRAISKLTTFRVVKKMIAKVGGLSASRMSYAHIDDTSAHGEHR